MLLLISTTLAVIITSALCSLSEAALYAIPWTYIENLRCSGHKNGQKLYDLRNNIDQPITAILTLNTVANTAGAAFAGALAAKELDPSFLPFFAAILTILILTFGEIIPKTIGVAYAPSIVTAMLVPITVLIFILKPFILLSSLLTRLVSPPATPAVTEDDIKAITSLSRKSGRIEAYEEHVIKNILTLDLKYAYEIMTPRTVVFSFHEKLTIGEAYEYQELWNYSRIPVYGEDNEDIVGIVQQSEIAKNMAKGHAHKLLTEIMQPVRFVPESKTVDRLLISFLETRQHLFVVLDEYGGLSGVVTLEDVLETMLGRNIVDESDAEPDLKKIARQRRLRLFRNK